MLDDRRGRLAESILEKASTNSSRGTPDCLGDVLGGHTLVRVSEPLRIYLNSRTARLS